MDVKEYFESGCDVIEYKDELYLSQMIKDKSEEDKLLLIQLVLNLLNKSTYNKNESDNDIKKIINVLRRYGIFCRQLASNNEYELKLENVKFSGSYSDIIEINASLYKKRLKDIFKDKEQWKTRIKREFDNMKKLSSSDYILKVYSYDSEENSYLMEVCECDLADYIENNPNLTEEECFTIFADILNGIYDAHSKAIIHRDLHLGNIMRKDGHFVIGDFGLSKDTMISADYKSSSTPKNSNMFMDPVGKSDFTKLDKQSDIYSIGKIFEYILTDKEYSSKMSFIIEKCINRDRNKRYKNVYEIISDFEEVKNGDRKILSEKELINNLVDSIYSIEIHDYIMNAIKESNLCNIIVHHKLYSFADLILQFDETEQEEIFREIYNYYIESTGYGGWENYDIYASISYSYINQSTNLITRKKAKDVLEGCASYRGRANNDFNRIKLEYPELF